MLRRGFCGIRAAAGRFQTCAPLTTSSTVYKDSKAEPPKEDGSHAVDQYIFREHCRTTRVASKDAQEVADRLRRNNYGAPKSKLAKSRTAPPAAEAAAAPPHGTMPATPSTKAAGFASSSGGSGTEDVVQELVEKGSKRMMQSDDGREELRQGSFDLDKTAERVLEEGKKEAGGEAHARADSEDVRDAVKSRVISGSQTS